VHADEEDHARPRQNIKTWIGLSVEESVRMTKDREMEKVRSWCGLRSRTAMEQNKTPTPHIDKHTTRSINRTMVTIGRLITVSFIDNLLFTSIRITRMRGSAIRSVRSQW